VLAHQPMVYLSLSRLLMQPILGNSNRRSVLAYSQVSCLPFGNFLDCGGPDGSIWYERVPMAFGTSDKVNHDAEHFPGFHVEAIDGVIGSHSRGRVSEFLFCNQYAIFCRLLSIRRNILRIEITLASYCNSEYLWKSDFQKCRNFFLGLENA
jgi:hypothetical protein